MDVGIVEAYAKNDEGKTTRKQFEVDLWSIRGVRDIIFRWLMI